MVALFGVATVQLLLSASTTYATGGSRTTTSQEIYPDLVTFALTLPHDELSELVESCSGISQSQSTSQGVAVNAQGISTNSHGVGTNSHDVCSPDSVPLSFGPLGSTLNQESTRVRNSARKQLRGFTEAENLELVRLIQSGALSRALICRRLPGRLNSGNVRYHVRTREFVAFAHKHSITRDQIENAIARGYPGQWPAGAAPKADYRDSQLLELIETMSFTAQNVKRVATCSVYAVREYVRGPRFLEYAAYHGVSIADIEKALKFGQRAGRWRYKDDTKKCVCRPTPFHLNEDMVLLRLIKEGEISNRSSLLPELQFRDVKLLRERVRRPSFIRWAEAQGVTRDMIDAAVLAGKPLHR